MFGAGAFRAFLGWVFRPTEENLSEWNVGLGGRLLWHVDLLIAYIIYLTECFNCSKAGNYLRNVCGQKSFAKYVEKLQESSPKVSFTINCYHYEQRTKTDSKGNSSTHSEQVITHTASMDYRIGSHKDETLSPQQMLAMFHLQHGTCRLEDAEKGGIKYVVKKSAQQALILLCAFPVDFHPHNASEESQYAASRSKFYAENIRDKHQDFIESCSVDFEGCTPNI